MNFSEAKGGNSPRCVSVDTSILFKNILLIDSVGSCSTEHVRHEKGACPNQSGAGEKPVKVQCVKLWQKCPKCMQAQNTLKALYCPKHIPPSTTERNMREIRVVCPESTLRLLKPLFWDTAGALCVPPPQRKQVGAPFCHKT